MLKRCDSAMVDVVLGCKGCNDAHLICYFIKIAIQWCKCHKYVKRCDSAMVNVVLGYKGCNDVT